MATAAKLPSTQRYRFARWLTQGLINVFLLLISLASCSGMDVVSLLRKQRQPVEGLEVHVRGQRRDEHPTVFTEIQLEYVIHGEDVAPAAVERAIELSRDRYCPVWAMLGQSVTITPRNRASYLGPAGTSFSSTPGCGRPIRPTRSVSQ